MIKTPKIHVIRKTYQGKIFCIEQLDLEFSNGVTRTYERVKSSGKQSVLVVPLLDDDTFLMIKEYAVGLERYELGFVKGIVDPGETVCEAANRELKEEIGYGANSLNVIKTLSTSPGYMSSQLQLVLARDLYEQRLAGDEPEEIEVVPWPWSKVDELLVKENFSDGRAIAALLLIRDLLNKGEKHE